MDLHVFPILNPSPISLPSLIFFKINVHRTDRCLIHFLKKYSFLTKGINVQCATFFKKNREAKKKKVKVNFEAATQKGLLLNTLWILVDSSCLFYFLKHHK